MAVLDHLVPVLARPVYGASDPLASLPLGVWLKAPFLPFKMNEKGRATTQILSVYDERAKSKSNFRASQPDDFRYRVLEKDGRRLVEVAQVRHARHLDRPTLSVGIAGDHDSTLPPSQHKTLAATASVDTQRWVEEKSSFIEGLNGVLARVFIIYPAIGLLGFYGLYKFSQAVQRPSSTPR